MNKLVLVHLNDVGFIAQLFLIVATEKPYGPMCKLSERAVWHLLPPNLFMGNGALLRLLTETPGFHPQITLKQQLQLFIRHLYGNFDNVSSAACNSATREHSSSKVAAHALSKHACRHPGTLHIGLKELLTWNKDQLLTSNYSNAFNKK